MIATDSHYSSSDCLVGIIMRVVYFKLRCLPVAHSSTEYVRVSSELISPNVLDGNYAKSGTSSANSSIFSSTLVVLMCYCIEDWL